MKSKTAMFIPVSVIAVLAACAGTTFAQTELLMFDDLPGVGGFNHYLPMPSGYGGLQWNNFLYMAGVDQPAGSGYANGVVSPGNIVFNGSGNLAIISDGVFNLNSAYLTAAWNDGLQVEVRGFTNVKLIYDQIYTINTTGPTLINFNFAGISHLQFVSSGGTPSGTSSGGGTQFVMDNLSVTIVPEPSTFTLAGVAGMSLIFRRRTARLSNSISKAIAKGQ